MKWLIYVLLVLLSLLAGYFLYPTVNKPNQTVVDSVDTLLLNAVLTKINDNVLSASEELNSELSSIIKDLNSDRDFMLSYFIDGNKGGSAVTGAATRYLSLFQFEGVSLFDEAGLLLASEKNRVNYSDSLQLSYKKGVGVILAASAILAEGGAEVRFCAEKSLSEQEISKIATLFNCEVIIVEGNRILFTSREHEIHALGESEGGLIINETEYVAAKQALYGSVVMYCIQNKE